MNDGKHSFERRQPVLLDYTEDDLDAEDLGYSGIVLQSPFYEFERRNSLKDTFEYSGTIMEDEDRCVISYRSGLDGRIVRDYVILKCMIKPHPDYEKLCHEWVLKY